jgi:ankyrin repeat protein
MIYPPSCSPQGLDKTSTAGTNTSEVPASANTYAKLERDLANERLHSARNLHEAGRSGYPEPLPNLGATNQWERVPATYGLSSIRARAREGISSARAKLSGGGGHGGARSPDRQLANYQRRHGVSELLRRTDLTPVGRLTELLSLLAAGVDVNQTVKVGWQAFRTSLLFEACVNGELMLVRTLLEHGADATRPYGPSGLTCLYNGMRARAQPCTVTLRVRVRSRLCARVCPLVCVLVCVSCLSPADRTSLIRLSRTPAVALNGHAAVARLLVEHCDAGAPPGTSTGATRPTPFAATPTADGLAPLYAACQGGHDGVVDVLLSAPSMTTELAERPIPVSLGGHTALHVACQGGHVECVYSLLDRMRVAIDPKTEGEGTTPLMLCLYLAARTPGVRHLQCAQLLLKAGASLALRDANGRSALDMAPAEWRDPLLAYRYAQNGRGAGSSGEDALLVALGRMPPGGVADAGRAKRGDHNGHGISGRRTHFQGTSAQRSADAGKGEAEGWMGPLCRSLRCCVCVGSGRPP